MALRVVEPVEEAPHPATARLHALVGALAEMTSDALAGVDDASDEADLVDQAAVLERLRSAVAAAQAAVMVRFGRARVERQLADEVHPRDIGRGVAEELGLACRMSATGAARRLGSARAWWFDLPHTYAALASGDIGEQAAEAVVMETRHLDGTTRRGVDARLHEAGVAELGPREAAGLARRYAYEADRDAYVTRCRHERRHRRIGLRPAPDTMSVLTGYLPVEQGVACLAALRRHTDGVVATGDERTRDQIMADTLVERVTGQASATDVAVEIQLVVPADVITDADSSRTAVVTGVGPLPGPLAREIVDASRGTKYVRHLHATPDGQLSGIGSKRRFSGALADLVRARDQTCRVPCCGAPVRHLDHVRRHADGGETSLVNGRGLCVRHNLVREQPGWTATVIHNGLGRQPTPSRRRHRPGIPTPPGHPILREARVSGSGPSL